MPERILGGGRTCGVSFCPFLNSSGWWWLVSSTFLSGTSCHKTTHAGGYYGAWPGWAVSASVLPLTIPHKSSSLSLVHPEGNDGRSTTVDSQCLSWEQEQKLEVRCLLLASSGCRNIIHIYRVQKESPRQQA